MSRVTFWPYFRHWYPSLTVSVVSEGSIREQILLTLIRLHEASKPSLRGLSTAFAAAASALPLAASPEFEGGGSRLSLLLFLLTAGGVGGGGDAACEARVESEPSGGLGLATTWLAQR